MGLPAAYVLDCSVAIAWLFRNQADDYTDSALSMLETSSALAPKWWGVEVVNVLLALERRGRLAPNKAIDALRHLHRLPVKLHDTNSSLYELHALAAQHQLTSYDALYLDAALTTGLPIATRDKGLQQAALISGVGVWGSN